MLQLLQAVKKCMPLLQPAVRRCQSSLSQALPAGQPHLSGRLCSVLVAMQMAGGTVCMGSKPSMLQVKEVQSLTCQLRPALVTTQSLSSGMLNSMAAPLGPMRWLVGCIRMASCTLRGSRSAWGRDMSSMGRQVAASAVWGSSLLSSAMRTVESVFQSVAVWRARGALLWPAGCQVAVAKLKLCLQRPAGSASKAA